MRLMSHASPQASLLNRAPAPVLRFTLRQHCIGAGIQEWRDAPWGSAVHDAEFSVSVATPEEAARAAEERRQENEAAVMQQEVGFMSPDACLACAGFRVVACSCPCCIRTGRCVHPLLQRSSWCHMHGMLLQSSSVPVVANGT